VGVQSELEGLYSASFPVSASDREGSPTPSSSTTRILDVIVAALTRFHVGRVHEWRSSESPRKGPRETACNFQKPVNFATASLNIQDYQPLRIRLQASRRHRLVDAPPRGLEHVGKTTRGEKPSNHERRRGCCVRRSPTITPETKGTVKNEGLVFVSALLLLALRAAADAHTTPSDMRQVVIEAGVLCTAEAHVASLLGFAAGLDFVLGVAQHVALVI